MLTHFRQRIAQKTADIHTAPVLIVALGDSVTNGMFAHHVLDQESVYHHQLWKLLCKRYPDCVFSMINAGIAGDHSQGGLARLDRDVIRHQPDLVIVGYGLNDACHGDDFLPNYTHAMAEIIARTRKETHADVVVLTPNFLVTRDNDCIHPEHRAANIHETFMKVQHGGTLARFAQAARQTAAKHHAAVADVFAKWESMAKLGVDTNAMLSNGLNHPNAQGQRIIADEVMKLIEAP